MKTRKKSTKSSAGRPRPDLVCSAHCDGSKQSLFLFCMFFFLLISESDRLCGRLGCRNVRMNHFFFGFFFSSSWPTSRARCGREGKKKQRGKELLKSCLRRRRRSRRRNVDEWWIAETNDQVAFCCRPSRFFPTGRTRRPTGRDSDEERWDLGMNRRRRRKRNFALTLWDLRVHQ